MSSSSDNNETTPQIPYPLESAEQLAECLIQHGIIEEAAWHDSAAYDRSVTLGRVYKMQAAVARIFQHNDQVELPPNG